MNKKFYLCAAVVCLLLSLWVAAQNDRKEAQTKLKQFFEGKKVIVKIDMPATRDGIDISPEKAVPMDAGKNSSRLNRLGTALAAGSTATVTEVEVSKDEIEFQLDGGGYGSPSDTVSEPPTPTQPAPVPKSQDELEIETELKTEKDYDRLRYLRSELQRLRDKREREDRWRSEEYEKKMQERTDIIWQRRRQRGSRFNVKFSKTDTATVTPDALMRYLAEYVDFSPLSGNSETKQTLVSENQTLPTNPPKMDDAAYPYFGEWSNARGETLKISGIQMQFGANSPVQFQEIFRLAAARVYALELRLAEANAKKSFVSLTLGENEIKLTYYDTLADLQNAANSRGEEIWRK